MMNTKVRMTAVCLLSVFTHSAYALLCPTNFNTILIGDSLDKVVSKCGEPTTKTTQDIEPPVPQQWSYLIPQTVSGGINSTMQGTLPVMITFDDKGKAININVNGIGVGATTICGGNIALGNTIEAVKSACGKPTFINKQQPENNNQPKEQEIIYTYGKTQLIFKNNILSGSQATPTPPATSTSTPPATPPSPKPAQ